MTMEINLYLGSQQDLDHPLIVYDGLRINTQRYPEGALVLVT